MKKELQWSHVTIWLFLLFFDRNESEEFHCFFEKVSMFAKQNSDKSLSKFSPDEYSEYKLYLKQINILNKEVVSIFEFYKMGTSELYNKHNDHQILKKDMNEIRVRELIW